MQAEKASNMKWKKALWILPAAALLFWQRQLIMRLLSQLFLGILAAFAALPLARPLEKKLKRSVAAALSIIGLIVVFAALFLLFVPFLITQTRQIAASVPAFYLRISQLLRQGEEWLMLKGIHIDETWKTELLSRGEIVLEQFARLLGNGLHSALGSIGKWMLTPVFAFYLVRDRREISEWTLMLFPQDKRGLIIRMLREMRRETIGYLRAQLMISAAIGCLTAAGLLLCGIPAWLLLGLVMAVLELIPYIGPFLGGIIVALFSWQHGLAKMLWGLGVIIVVQQIEGNLLAPKLTGDATRLHPLAILLGILAGGSLAGVTGILLAVPVILCVRTLVQVLCMERMEEHLSFSFEKNTAQKTKQPY